jgi:hypothetical protein
MCPGNQIQVSIFWPTIGINDTWMMAKSYSELQSLKQIIMRTILFTTFVAEEIEVMATQYKTIKSGCGYV